MKKQHYLALMAWSRQTPRRAFFLEMLCRVLPMIAGGLYLVAAVWLLVIHAPELPRFLAVPALTLALVSLLRRALNRPRPYEVWPEATPLLRSHHRGKGCPSRHAASGLVIALAGLAVWPLLGVVLMILALAIGASRVVAGVHFLGDVLWGFGLAALCGVLLFL